MRLVALAMTGQTTPRPLTHDVMATIVEALTGPDGELRLDTPRDVPETAQQTDPAVGDDVG